MILTDYINYWETLVASHRHIKSFFRLNETEIDDALRHTLQYPAFQLFDYDGEIRQGANQHRFFDVQKCSFILFDNIVSGDYNAEHQKLSNLKKWGLGLLSKLYDDTQNGFKNCPLYPFMLDESSIKYYITDFKQEHNKGILFEFDLIDYQFEFVHDPNDFN